MTKKTFISLISPSKQNSTKIFLALINYLVNNKRKKNGEKETMVTGRLKNEKRIRAAEEGENSQGKKEVR